MTLAPKVVPAKYGARRRDTGYGKPAIERLVSAGPLSRCYSSLSRHGYLH